MLASMQAPTPISPAQIASSNTEHGHQAAVCQWVVLEGRHRFPNMDMLFAIPNGGDRRPSVGATLMAEGVKKGVPDLMLPIPVGLYPGLFIEMKRPDGRIRPDQIEWHQKLRSQGYAVVEAFNWMSAVKALIDYYNGRLVMPNDGTALLVVDVDGVKVMQ